ncbi:mandelate racemase/muconate lactonizing enzyme family protein [Citreimonas salinaria]|uniref:L-alanine-DL-glutamate epimerase n=1 Tax=Citreimonas salinaria TaxID=321339 RepID=A0A1H3NHJ6_9RHOB|nr:enolase C-terminal domain-like protein [Citreimonas salinaria]SDY88213.1 L-alanine-DL-glutamate epimerase [Citreimonas salinaria]
MAMPSDSIGFSVRRIDAFAFRVPIEAPVHTSFGIMRDRPAVFIRIEDTHGGFGWGEVFANWPAAGAEHRVNLLMDDVAAMTIGQSWPSPREMFLHLVRATRIRALQCGEPGPFAQVIAGLDIAGWDLVARRAGKPLAKMLSADAAERVDTYASGIKVDDAPGTIPASRAAGFTRFKVKVGFGANDIEKVLALADVNLAGELLFVDANQAWSFTEAREFIDRTMDASLGWVEEPLPVFAAREEWAGLAEMGVPIAGGENIFGEQDFGQAVSDNILSVIQPDLVKWGGISGCFEVAKRVREGGKLYCPHFLGGGIGLAASAQLLAAAGGAGMLEVDVNMNPLRSLFHLGGARQGAGYWEIGSEPGLGVVDLPEALFEFLTLHRTFM